MLQYAYVLRVNSHIFVPQGNAYSNTKENADCGQISILLLFYTCIISHRLRTVYYTIYIHAICSTHTVPSLLCSNLYVYLNYVYHYTDAIISQLSRNPDVQVTTFLEPI